jgi:hypothetical protein
MIPVGMRVENVLQAGEVESIFYGMIVGVGRQIDLENVVNLNGCPASQVFATRCSRSFAGFAPAEYSRPSFGSGGA